jgi:hypothetical protein
MEWIVAASTSCSSAASNASGSSWRAATSTLTADIEITPRSSARRVTSICSSPRAPLTSARAVPQATRNRVESHEVAER